MKNVEIVIDASGSADMVAIEKYLMHLQFDPSLENDNIQVSFYSAGERLRERLKNIDLNLDVGKNFFGGGDNYSDIIKEKFEKNPDMVIFISDCMEFALDKKSINNNKTILLVVSTQNLKDAENYLRGVKDLPNIKYTTSKKYLSLHRLLENNNSFKNKLDKLRKSNVELTDNKLKP